MFNRKIKLTKKFNFDMAHALFGHDGHCKNIHGHTYQLEITVEGIPRERLGTTNDGMVMDFGVLKSLVNELILNKLDHALVAPPFQTESLGPPSINGTNEKVICRFARDQLLLPCH